MNSNLSVPINLLRGDNIMSDIKSNSNQNANKSNLDEKLLEIKPYSKIEETRSKELSQKETVKKELLKTLKQAKINADKHVNEYTLNKFDQIFTTTKDDNTKITLRYGPTVFFNGIVETKIVYPKAKNNEKKQNDDFASKIYLLDQLISSVNDEDWYNNQYEEYYENRKKAIAKAKLTRAKNKADTLNQRV